MGRQEAGALPADPVHPIVMQQFVSFRADKALRICRRPIQNLTRQIRKSGGLSPRLHNQFLVGLLRVRDKLAAHVSSGFREYIEYFARGSTEIGRASCWERV